ncbi:MAG TPA: radical SAM protein [Mobilitalea sp.]|nr:radical SAM protein [Mobilitalea sp.]
MTLLRNYQHKKDIWREGVAHVTLDPDGPGVARLHLVPPKPRIYKNPPSLLIINGTWFLPVGPSWAALLRYFFEELKLCCEEKQELSMDEITQIEQAVVKKMQKLYPKVNTEVFLNDLKEIVTLSVNIATNQEVPEETRMGLSLEKYSRYMTAPHRMDLIVAPMAIHGKRACPLNCVCCYADSGKLMDTSQTLSTEDWIKIIDKCRDSGIPMLTFTGGEPLTRPDIVELVKHAEWFVTRLNTNGYLLTKELAYDLQKASLDGIQITLYSHDSRIHDALVGKEGAFERTLGGIKNALAAGLSVSINTPLVEKNRDFAKTIRFVHELGIGCIGCSSLIPTGGAVEQIAAGKALSSEDLRNLLSEAVAVCNELHMDISFTSPGWLDPEELLRIGLPSAPACGACLSNMAVSPTGEVVPCQSWLNGMSLGNMLTDSWEDIWNHKDCKRIRKSYSLKNKCGIKEDAAR